MSTFAFHVFGTPGAKGSREFKGRDKKGRAILVESSRTLPSFVEAIKAAAPAADGPLEGPLVLRAVFTVKRPGNARKAARRPATNPDLDKYLRGLCDAITQLGLWRDDAQVCEVERLAKVWYPHDDESLPVPGVVVACRDLADGTDLRHLTDAEVAKAMRRLGRAS